MAGGISTKAQPTLNFRFNVQNFTHTTFWVYNALFRLSRYLVTIRHQAKSSMVARPLEVCFPSLKTLSLAYKNEPFKRIRYEVLEQ
jgi:hypothetical protein